MWTTLSRDNDGLITRYGPFTITRSGPAGAPSALTDNTLSISYTYDSFGRLYTRNHTVAGQEVYQLTLAYDNVGRISTKTETLAGTSHVFDYTYDLDGQLFDVRKDGVLVEQYNYDNNANRTSTLAATASYDDQDRLIEQGGVNYTFDADGFIAQRGADSFTYSSRGELLSATVGGQTVAYQYDGIGRRIGRIDIAGTTQYLYGNLGDPFQLTASRDAAGTLTTYSYDVVRMLVSIERGGQRYYVATDQLGTPKAVTDTTGVVVKIVEYDPWGVKIGDTNPTFDLPVGFAGGIADAATGTVRFGWRDYESGTGRWLARDPIMFAAGHANLFQYLSNDPVNLIDPSGLVDLNLFNPKEPIFKYAGRANSPPNTFTVGGHGNPNTIVDASGKEIPPEQLAEMIRKNPKFKPGMSIKLMSCNTGRSPGSGKDSYGKKLSEKMGEDVEAPNNLVWYYQNGNTVVAPPNSGGGGPALSNKGGYNLFYGGFPSIM